MDINLLKNTMIKYAAKLTEDNLLGGGKDIMTARIDADSFLATKCGADLSNLTVSDIIVVPVTNVVKEYQTVANIYVNREDIGAVIHTYSQFCSIVAEAGVTIPAVLDDMAQIVGPTCRVAKSDNGKLVIKAMKGRFATLVKNEGVISCGRTLDEACTTNLVLEKGAKVFVEAEALGGASVIGKFDAVLMRFVYKKKYSKKDQESKLAETK